jgi:hypothetical protein
MTSEHFIEIFYTVMMSTHSTKRDLRNYLNLTKTTLNKYLRYGVPDSKKFLVMDRLEVYLFENLGGNREVKQA